VNSVWPAGSNCAEARGATLSRALQLVQGKENSKRKELWGEVEATMRHFILATAAGFVASVASAATAPNPAGFPSPWAAGGLGWDEAYSKAKEFVSGLTLVEKVNLTTGTGWEADRWYVWFIWGWLDSELMLTFDGCSVGVTGSVPRLGFRGFCLQDGPLGIRYSK